MFQLVIHQRILMGYYYNRTWAWCAIYGEHVIVSLGIVYASIRCSDWRIIGHAFRSLWVTLNPALLLSSYLIQVIRNGAWQRKGLLVGLILSLNLSYYHKNTVKTRQLRRERLKQTNETHWCVLIKPNNRNIMTISLDLLSSHHGVRMEKCSTKSCRTDCTPTMDHSTK